MQRKTLTFVNEKGLVEDLIPYVDDLAIKVGGTNLRDYLAQIENTIQLSTLFLGAFESETLLLEKYPNGSNLTVGTYAIVSDSDSLYIYDTDNLRWLKTASATLGIVQLNGLNAINGSLTITGGDIKSIVSGAEKEEGTITEHLSTLYEKNKSLELLSYGTIAYSETDGEPEISTDITYKASVSEYFKNAKFLVTKLELKNISSVDKEKVVNIKITYTDGTSMKYGLYSANGLYLTCKTFETFLSTDISNPIITIYLDKNNYMAYVLPLNTYANTRTMVKTYNINNSNWVDNEEGGYAYTITAESSIFTNSYSVVGVYKEINGKRTTAIIDYVVDENIITIYSDEKFSGGLTFTYIAG